MIKKFNLIFAILSLSACCFASSQTQKTIKTDKYAIHNTYEDRKLIRSHWQKTPKLEHFSPEEIKEILIKYDTSWKEYKSIFGVRETWISPKGYTATRLGVSLMFDFSQKEKEIGADMYQSNTTANRPNKYNLTNQKHTIKQAIKAYGQPSSRMKATNTTILIFKTPIGKITETYDANGICTASKTDSR